MTAQQLDDLIADEFPPPSPWKLSGRGNWTRMLPDGARVTLFKNGTAYYWCLAQDAATVSYSSPHATVEAAFRDAQQMIRDQRREP